MRVLPVRSAALIPTVGAAVVLLASCGLPATTTSAPDPAPVFTAPEEPYAPPSGPSQDPQPSITASTVSVPPAPTPADTISPTVDAVDQPVATRNGSIEDHRVRATLYPVRRVGDTATVNVWIVSQNPKESFRLFGNLSDGDTNVSSKDLDAVDGLRLIDPSAKRMYLPAVTADGECVCSPAGGALLDEATSTWVTVTFSAPPAELSLIDVSVPRFGTFTNVPIR